MRCYYPKSGYPCGRCPACLLNKQRSFAFRLEQEQRSSSYTMWITLTYEDSHLPRDETGEPCVSKPDCRRFFDKIRKAFPSIKTKHFLCSEYGPKTFRPHYHCLLFCQDPAPVESHWVNYRNMIDYIQTKAWKNGFVCIKPLNMNVYKYVSKYCCKPELIDFSPRVKPFQLISQGIGISLLYQLDIASCMERMDFSVRDGRGGKIELPRYYKQKILPVSKPLFGLSPSIEEIEEWQRAREYWDKYNAQYSLKNFNKNEAERLEHPIRRSTELPYYDYVASKKAQSVLSFTNKLKKRSDL